jgi:hypothetical protein
MTPALAGSVTTDPGQSLSVVADLRLETAGQRIQLVGDGQSLVLHTDHPFALFAAINRTARPSAIGPSSGRRGLGRAADALHRAGLRVDVRGPGGVLVSLGHGAGSRWGRLLTGSRAVAVGPAREVAASLGAGLPLRRITTATITAAGVVVAALVVGRARKTR